MLQVKNLVKHFGGVQAFDDVSFNILPRECVALIGPNGAGKSTCFSCIAGQYQPASGSMLWDGQTLNGLLPAARLRYGVGRTFQGAQVFDALTVLQNVQLAAQAHWDSRAISVFHRLDRQLVCTANTLLEKTGLQSLKNEDLLSLLYAGKKRLELAITLAANPRLLLLDEPAAGLESEERANLMRLVKSLAAQGLAVLHAEHNMDAVAGVADRVLVLIEGRLAAQGTFDDISRDSTVRRRYLGAVSGSRVSGLTGEGAAHA